MNRFSRRDFFGVSSLSLASIGTGSLVLSTDAQPTESSGDLTEYAEVFKNFSVLEAPANWDPTQSNSEGPYYRRGAPYRAKITPPGEPGKVLLIRGRVWGSDSHRPLPHTVLEVWQANADGRYDNSAPDKPVAKNVFLNRARFITDETGYYEFETIHPGPYQAGVSRWRASHINYTVRHPSYRMWTTRIYFRGDPHQDQDEFVKPSLIIDLQEHKVGQAIFRSGRFDIILAPA
jgi:catechol 1,2-dioxygenase